MKQIPQVIINKAVETGKAEHGTIQMNKLQNYFTCCIYYKSNF